jgi:hypothetical protein
VDFDKVVVRRNEFSTLFQVHEMEVNKKVRQKVRLQRQLSQVEGDLDLQKKS